LQRQFSLHGLPIKPPINLGARTPHCRALGAVQETKLDSGPIGQPTHYAIQRINLSHQMALAQTADGRIAGHLAQPI
jgi:hypothetical protein